MNELPEGWEEVPLSMLCIFNPRHNSSEDRKQEISFVPMPAVSDTDGRIEDHGTKVLGDVWKGYTHFQEGDVIFAKITPCMENGKIAVARGLHGGIACGSTEFHVLRPFTGVNAKYLWYFLRRRDFRIEAERHMTGAVGQRRVPKAYLEKYLIPLPPANEQCRIVTKLDSLFERTRRAREELSHIPRLIENYKKGILTAAFQGKLIAATPYQNWKVRSVEDLAKVGTGATPKRGNAKYYDNGTVPWVTSGAVNQQIIREAEEFITEIALSETNCKVFPSGTLLVAMYGEGLTRGKVARLAIDTATNQALAAIQLNNENVVSRDYLFWFLQSNYLALRALAAGGVQPNLNLGIIKKIKIPIPPLEEQRSIVRKIETAMDWLKVVNAEQSQAVHLLDRLDQVNFAKAFRGELVPQDQNDEPVSVLLERIRSEHGAQVQSRSRRKSMEVVE